MYFFMLATVTLRHPDGTLHRLHHGDIIGRLWSAALHIDDGNVSEAHALVSLRGSELRLLALRGLFAVDGKPLKELTLRPGQRVAITRSLVVEVVDVALPSSVLALCGPGLVARPLDGVCSLVADPRLRIAPKNTPGALAVFWFTGEGWRVRVGEAVAHLEPGWGLDTPHGRVEAISLPLSQGGMRSTIDAGRLIGSLVLECHYDTVHIHRSGLPSLTLSGQPAIVISELAGIPAPVAWDGISRIIWPDESDRYALRRRWDVLMARIRRKLRASGVREDLVKPDGSGNFCLLMRPGDRIEDHS